MEIKRFITSVRYHKDKALPYVAYITDNATGMKFSNSFDTDGQANDWIERAKETLTKGRNL